MLSFENMDTSIYCLAAQPYCPDYVSYLFVAESPPAFEDLLPDKFFYFLNTHGAELLFSTIIKAVFDIDYNRNPQRKHELLLQFRDAGYFLTDSVSYPINNIPTGQRLSIIQKNIPALQLRIQLLTEQGKINEETKTILIKETVYNALHNVGFLNVINTETVHFPRYVRDVRTIEQIRALINQ
jgi:hypothetical protein